MDHSRLGAFIRFVESTRDVRVGSDYHALWRWSVTDLPGFWSAVWDYFAIAAHTPPEYRESFLKQHEIRPVG